MPHGSSFRTGSVISAERTVKSVDPMAAPALQGAGTPHRIALVADRESLPPSFTFAPVIAVVALCSHGGHSAGHSELAWDRLAMKSSTSCSAQRAARLPIRTGFENLDSAISA